MTPNYRCVPRKSPPLNWTVSVRGRVTTGPLPFGQGAGSLAQGFESRNRVCLPTACRYRHCGVPSQLASSLYTSFRDHGGCDRNVLCGLGPHACVRRLLVTLFPLPLLVN